MLQGRPAMQQPISGVLGRDGVRKGFPGGRYQNKLCTKGVPGAKGVGPSNLEPGVRELHVGRNKPALWPGLEIEKEP
jgi:hypothetical protein